MLSRFSYTEEAETCPSWSAQLWWLHFQNKSQEISHGRAASLGDSLGGHQQDVRGRTCKRERLVSTTSSLPPKKIRIGKSPSSLTVRSTPGTGEGQCWRSCTTQRRGKTNRFGGENPQSHMGSPVWLNGDFWSVSESSFYKNKTTNLQGMGPPEGQSFPVTSSYMVPV